MNRTLYIGLEAMEAPAYLKRTMLVRGGTNPYGEPMYRLVRTEGRKRLSGGKWHDWPKDLAVRYRNPGINRARRVVWEVRPVPVYIGEHGWVLEKWLPPESYGSPVLWNSPQSMGGTMKWIPEERRYIPGAGPFPYRGDYEGTDYIFPNYAVSEALICNAIGRIVRERDGMPADPLQRAMQQANYDTEIERKREEAAAALEAQELDEALAELRVRTLGGQAEVCRLAESMGIREHPF